MRWLGLAAPRSHAELAVEIARIGDLDAPALRALWPDWFGKPPPVRMRRETLGLAMAYRIQCETLGGLSRQAARTLDAIAAQEFGAVAASAPVTAPRLKPGTKLPGLERYCRRDGAREDVRTLLSPGPGLPGLQVVQGHVLDVAKQGASPHGQVDQGWIHAEPQIGPEDDHTTGGGTILPTSRRQAGCHH